MMDREQFVDQTARLVAGLQAPVSMTPHGRFGTAFEPWQKLLGEVNGGFGWTNADACRETFAEIVGVSLAGAETPGEDPPPAAADDRPYPEGNDNGARLKRWLVDNDENPVVREDSGTPSGMTGGEVYALLRLAADRFHWHGADDIQERLGTR
jgi:hypothetical protein